VIHQYNNALQALTTNKYQLTPMDRATSSRPIAHRALHKVERYQQATVAVAESPPRVRFFRQICCKTSPRQIQTSVQENVCNNSENVKSHVYGFSKNAKK